MVMTETNHLKTEVDLTHKTLYILNIPHMMDNVQYNCDLSQINMQDYFLFLA
jgi:hypothetical protein